MDQKNSPSRLGEMLRKVCRISLIDEQVPNKNTFVTVITFMASVFCLELRREDTIHLSCICNGYPTAALEDSYAEIKQYQMELSYAAEISQ
jgi:hypothetical protein